ncbi:MAG TPA: metallophosphoesterase [Bacteroidota bacterium]|jgi:Icc-related predicted phosphoesterase
MKILALTDIHGAYKKAKEIIDRHPSDVVLIGGDLTTAGSVKEAEEAIRLFQTGPGRIFSVSGNMDLPQHDQMMARVGVSLDSRGVKIDGIGFFGVSAAPVSPMHTPYEISEEEIARRIEAGFLQVRECPVKVFVPHAPPYGTRVDIIHMGIHVGSTAVRDFIEENSPAVVVCGHIHEGRGQDRLEGSRIVNCGAAMNGYFATIDIGEEITIENHQLGH